MNPKRCDTCGSYDIRAHRNGDHTYECTHCRTQTALGVLHSLHQGCDDYVAANKEPPSISPSLKKRQSASPMIDEKVRKDAVTPEPTPRQKTELSSERRILWNRSAR